MNGHECTDPLVQNVGVVQEHQHLMPIVELQQSNADVLALNNYSVQNYLFSNTYVRHACWQKYNSKRNGNIFRRKETGVEGGGSCGELYARTYLKEIKSTPEKKYEIGK